MGSAVEQNSGGHNNRFAGPLAVERAVMLSAVRTLERLSQIDCSRFSREQIADHTVAMVSAAERVRTVSARFMAVSESQASSLTKGARYFGEIQRRMIRLRDNRCRHLGCRRTARTCEYDHVEPYERGGPNGQLLCRFHHRYKHRNVPHGPRIFDDSPIQIE